jgi:outer membrane receptor for ferrienterochelin and colicins
MQPNRIPHVAILAAAFAASVLGSGRPAEAQTAEGPSSLTVTVKDNWGVIPGVSVRIFHHETRSSWRATTDSSGAAVFASLPAGTYDLRASLTGFVDGEQTAIPLAEGESKSVDATLTLVQFSTTVTVTTANRREQLLLDVAEPTTLIDEAQIQDTGGATAKDVLAERSGAGVQVQAGGGQGHVSINGIPNSGVLVLVDGRRYIGRDGIGNFDLEDFDLTSVERVEVVKGAGSALYGSDALGGVINFITKKSTARGTTNRVDFTGGSFTDVRVGDSLKVRGERGGFVASGGFRTYDGFDLDPSNPQTIGLPESRYYDFDTTGDVELSDKVKARLFGQYTLRTIDNYFFTGATQLGTEVYNSQRRKERYTLSPELDFVLADETTLDLSFNYSKYTREETNTYRDSGRIDVIPPWQEWNKEFRATGRQAWNAFGQKHTLQAGYEFRKEEMERANLNLPGGAGSANRTDRDINVFWAQQELNLGPNLKLTGGFRYDDYSDFGSEWSPKASAVVTLARDHRLRGSWGQGFRAPSFGELFINLGAFFMGNPDLKPVVSDTWTAGYAYAGPKVQASIDYFDAKLDNQIVFDFSGFPFGPITYGNIPGKSTSKGVNVELAFNLPGGFTPSVAFTHNERKDSEGEKIGGFPPSNSAFAKLVWSHPGLGIRANLSANIVGEEDPLDDTVVPAYQEWSFQVSKRIATRGRYAVRLWAQVGNLTDESDIFLRSATTGAPIVEDGLQIWLAPRSYLGGITIDMDWTR